MGVSKVDMGMYGVHVCEDESISLCDIYMTHSEEDIQ